MAPVRVSSASEASKYIDEIIKSHKVVVFSKSYCPYCIKANDLLRELYKGVFILELDKLQENDGDVIQDELQKKTKQRTVPNVFINGKHIGGCDDTMKLHKQGTLVALING